MQRPRHKPPGAERTPPSIIVTRYYLEDVDLDLIARMKDRVQRVRRIASMAHDPLMIKMLLQMAEEGEADIRRLRTELAAAPTEIEIVPLPPQQ